MCRFKSRAFHVGIVLVLISWLGGGNVLWWPEITEEPFWEFEYQLLSFLHLLVDFIRAF